jgi:hypothetical protein
MKKLILSIILITISFFANSQSTDLPQYLIEGGDTIGIIISVEQAQSLDNDAELLSLFKQLRMDCDNLDSYYLQVINSLDQKMGLLEIKNKELYNQSVEKMSLIENLNKQIENCEQNKDLCDDQISIKNEEVKTLKGEIRRQKIRKFISIGGNVVLAVITTLLIIKS